VCRHTHTKEV